jgi:hypothetical protein
MMRVNVAALTVCLAFITGCAPHRPSPDAQGGAHAAGAVQAPSGNIPCDDAQFATDQSEFAAGSITGDQLVDVCGTVARVLAARETRSGDHGYFFVTLPSGSQIEVVSNLDAMAHAASDTPPSWPWVATGNYVYVQGRYYYDNASRQGIDWTEDDTSNSWPHIGYVYVCDSAGSNCSRYW